MQKKERNGILVKIKGENSEITSWCNYEEKKEKKKKIVKIKELLREKMQK